MNLNQPDEIDIVLGRFFLALKRALEKPQLLPYLREKIYDDVDKGFATITDQEVRDYFNSLKSENQKTFTK